MMLGGIWTAMIFNICVKTLNFALRFYIVLALYWKDCSSMFSLFWLFKSILLLDVSFYINLLCYGNLFLIRIDYGFMWSTYYGFDWPFKGSLVFQAVLWPDRSLPILVCYLSCFASPVTVSQRISRNYLFILNNYISEIQISSEPISNYLLAP